MSKAQAKTRQRGTADERMTASPDTGASAGAFLRQKRSIRESNQREGAFASDHAKRDRKGGRAGGRGAAQRLHGEDVHGPGTQPIEECPRAPPEVEQLAGGGVQGNQGERGEE